METTAPQAFIFLITLYGGMIAGLVYDIYRAIRKLCKSGRWVTALLDTLFILTLGVVVTVVWPVEKVMLLPLTVKLEPLAGVAASVSEFAADTSLVAAVIATGVVRLLLTVVPVTVLLVPGPSRLLAVAPVMTAEVTLDLVA